MNTKRTLSRRELLDRLYQSAGHDIDDDSLDDELYYDEIRRHPEAPLNDTIELEKRAARPGRSANERAGREGDLEDDLEYLEFIAEKRARQRRRRQAVLEQRNDFESSQNDKLNSKNRHWASCRPVLVGCALTCLLTAGLVKGQDISTFIISNWFNPNLQQTQPIQPIQISNRWFTSTPMVTDRSNSMARVAGLTASKSTITGFADSQSMTAAYYWTLLVSNSGQQNQEARMRIALPAGATLSRATLWVNGVAQEAAFSTTEQVTAAYTWVRDGREQHRFLSHDPLVITQETPGHLLVKAAPVTPGNQPLQLRLGFTSPLIPTSTQDASMRLPQITESNFEVKGTQDVHLQSATSVWSNESEVTAIPDQGGFLLRGNIDEDRLTSLRVNVAGNGSEQFATRATHSPKGTFIVASMKPDASGRMNLSLKKTTTRPTCRIINSEPAAVRLSTLWAYGQVEASVKRGDRFTANELARVFRIVSSVSGATVLEQDSDYLMQGLSRDQFATYDRRAGAGAGGAAFVSIAANRAEQQSFARAQAPAAAPVPMEFTSSLSSGKPTASKNTDTDEVLISDEDLTAKISTAQRQQAQAQVETSVPVQSKQILQLLLPITLIAGLLFAFSKLGRTLPQQLFAKFKK